MQLFLTLAAVVAVSVAVPTQHGPIVPDLAGPAIVENPLPDAGAESPPNNVNPAGVPTMETPVRGYNPNKPLVYILVNIEATASAASAITITIGPINVNNNVFPRVVDDKINPVVVDPVQVEDPIVPGPINVVDKSVLEPVVVETPVIPAPVVVLLEELV